VPRVVDLRVLLPGTVPMEPTEIARLGVHSNMPVGRFKR
jgi:hypothetical protein